MKKGIFLPVVLLLLCLFTACRTRPAPVDGSAAQTDVTDTANTSDTSDTADTADSTIAAAVTTATVDNSTAEESTAADSSSPQSTINSTRSTQTTGCVHEYVTKVVAPTCTEQGYTLHTCKKCGKSYRDSFVAPRHEYGKYLCEICGRPDPSTPIYSLGAWLEKNGTLAGNGIYSSIDYKENGISYSISTNIYYTGSIYFESDKENNPDDMDDDEILSIYMDNTDQCTINYDRDKIGGDVKLKKSAVCSSSPLKLNEFENNGSTVCSKDEFTAQMSSKIDGFMNIIQNKMLYPRTGLKLKDFGFTKF